MWLYEMSLNCIVWNGWFYVMWISPQNKTLPSLQPWDELSGLLSSTTKNFWNPSTSGFLKLFICSSKFPTPTFRTLTCILRGYFWLHLCIDKTFPGYKTDRQSNVGSAWRRWAGLHAWRPFPVPWRAAPRCRQTWTGGGWWRSWCCQLSGWPQRRTGPRARERGWGGDRGALLPCVILATGWTNTSQDFLWLYAFLYYFPTWQFLMLRFSGSYLWSYPQCIMATWEERHVSRSLLGFLQSSELSQKKCHGVQHCLAHRPTGPCTP